VLSNQAMNALEVQDLLLTNAQKFVETVITTAQMLLSVMMEIILT